MSFGIVDIAIQLALEAHGGTRNKHDGELYLHHVHRVASNFDTSTLDGEVRAAVAWLHDTVEDTDLTVGDIEQTYLYRGFTEVAWDIANAVQVLTKVKGQSNEDYYLKVFKNDIARDVKERDILDNFGRNHLIEDEHTRLRMAQKYSLGLDILCRQR